MIVQGSNLSQPLGKQSLCSFPSAPPQPKGGRPGALGTVPFGLQQSGREESCGGWEGDIDDTRME